MLPTSCKPDKSAVSSMPTPQAPPFPPLRVAVGWTPQGDRIPKIRLPALTGQLLLHLPLCPLQATGSPSPRPHSLTFPCISIRSIEGDAGFLAPPPAPHLSRSSCPAGLGLGRLGMRPHCGLAGSAGAVGEG